MAHHGGGILRGGRERREATWRRRSAWHQGLHIIGRRPARQVLHCISEALYPRIATGVGAPVLVCRTHADFNKVKWWHNHLAIRRLEKAMELPWDGVD